MLNHDISISTCVETTQSQQAPCFCDYENFLSSSSSCLPLYTFFISLPVYAYPALPYRQTQLKLGVGLKMQENVTCGICSELSRCLNAPIEKDIRAGLGQWEDCSWEKDGLGHGQGVLHSNAWLYCSPAKARGSWKLIFLDTQLLILRAWAFIVAITPSHSSLLHTCLLFPINAGG